MPRLCLVCSKNSATDKTGICRKCVEEAKINARLKVMFNREKWGEKFGFREED